jgi:hypothetical protein
MDRKNVLIWLIVGIVLFIACYVEAMQFVLK